MSRSDPTKPVALQLKRAAVVLAAIAAVTSVYATHLYLFLTLRGGQTTIGLQFAESAVHTLAWLLVVPAIFWFTSRYPLRWNVGRVVLHLIASLAAALLQVAVRAAADDWLIHREYTVAALQERFVSLFTRGFFAGVLIYWAILLTRNAVALLRHQSEIAALREKELAEARLRILQNQLQPHFLFNTLNSIASLMRTDVDAADRMLGQLSALLRALLDDEAADEIRVDRELELLQSYVSIQQARLAERLRFSLDADGEALGAAIPRLLLQPLVENAIRHGIAVRREGGRVVVSVRRRSGRLRIDVEDDGAGLSGNGKPAEGVGLKNCRSRLRQLYGDDQTFAVSARPSGGVNVAIDIPYRLLGASA